MRLKLHHLGMANTFLLLLLLLTSLTDGTTIVSNRSACRQAKAPGLCRGKFLRYAYNEETGNCVSFYYTGCASTANNFLTFEECRRDCMQKLRY